MAVAVFLAAAAARRAPQDLFGAVHDDSLYFATAKALAAGEGFVMPSVPGEPPQTKYPIVYPALLSAVWSVQPEFPDNLDWAWGLTVLFAAAGVAASVPLARQLGASRFESLAITALLALNPFYLYWSNLLVSDTVFYALAIGAAVAAQAALECGSKGRRSLPWWIATIALLWLACSTRTLGVAFAAGIAATALWRRAWLPAAAALSPCLPVALEVLGGVEKAALPAAAAAWDGFRHNLWYYASYADFWRHCVPNLTVLERQLSVTFLETLKHPAVSVFMLPAIGIGPMWLQLIAVTLSVGTVAGVVRRARRHGLHPLHLSALFYLPIILLWNYPLMTRFGLPFLMLLLAGASDQIQSIAEQLRKTLRQGPAADRAIGLAFAACLAAVLLYGADRMLRRVPQAFESQRRQRADRNHAKSQAYAWLRRNTDPGEIVMSYEDAALYLYAGRQGMRPVSMTTEAFFMQDAQRFERDLANLGDTALALEADYWLVTPDDYASAIAPETTRKRIARLLEDAPVAFRSDDGETRVIRLGGTSWTLGPASKRTVSEASAPSASRSEPKIGPLVPKY